MADSERVALAQRLKDARLHTAARRREEVTKDGMAAILSEVLGRALHPTQWRRYEDGKSEPPLDVIRAAAAVSGLADAYIAFGAGAEVLIIEAKHPGEAAEEPTPPKPGREIKELPASAFIPVPRSTATAKKKRGAR